MNIFGKMSGWSVISDGVVFENENENENENKEYKIIKNVETDSNNKVITNKIYGFDKIMTSGQVKLLKELCCYC